MTSEHGAVRDKAGRGAPRQGDTAAADIAARVKAKIIGGEIELGAPVTEKWLTETFGASRTTIRVVLHTLLGEGYLVQEPFHSARVRTYAPGEIEEILEARLVIETHAARMSASASSEAREAVMRAMRAYDSALDTQDQMRIASTHRDLHVALVGVAGNRALCRVESLLTQDCALFIDVVDFRRADVEKMRIKHRELAEAFVAGDVDLAVALVEEHLTMVTDAALEEIPSDPTLR